MKINYLLISLFAFSFAKAQLYVSNNASTYVYVNDAYLYVTGNVELNGGLNSNIYLRKDAQLLQGGTGASSNIGLGSLSVYQEGTVNNFQYNYWCSPVGGRNASAASQGFGITQLGVPSVALNPTSFNAATILASSNYNGVSANGSLSIAPYWIWKFIARNAYDLNGPTGWISVGGTSTLNPGEGFTMKGTSGTDNIVPFTGAAQNRLLAGATATASGDQRYDFRGIPNDGNINIPMVVGNQSLTGNPYPSAIDLRNLLIANGPTAGGGTNVCDGTALFWEHDKTVNSHYLNAYKGGYGVYNGASNAYTPATFYAYDGAGTQLGSVGAGQSYQRRFSPVGQGFMVRCTATAGNAAGNFVIRNSYRTFVKEAAANFSEFQKPSNVSNNNSFYDEIPNVAGIDYTTISSAPTPQIRINTLLNNQAVRQVAMVFMDNAVEGYDAADSQSADVNANLPYDMYFNLVNSEFVHNANKFDINNKYSIGFKCNTDAVFRMKVAEIVNFDQAQNVYLHDKLTNEYFDIKNSEATVNLTTGVNNSRYELTFVNAALATDDNFKDNFNIYQNNASTMLTIKNPDLVDVVDMKLYDVQGKLVLDKKDLGTNSLYEFNTSSFSQGIYIVKLITKTNQEITRKVSITNRK